MNPYFSTPKPGRIMKEDGSWVNEADGINPDGSRNVTVVTALSSSFDSVNVDRMGKGGTVVAHNAISATATSAPIDMTGFHHLSIELTASALTAGNYVVELLGSSLIAGTYGAINKIKDDGSFAALKTPTINANGNYVYEFTNIGAKYVQLRATRTTDGTLTVKATPYN